MATNTRGSFSSRIGFIAAAAGSAVGLGNIWKFPYEVGENGGAAFLLVYVICAFVICLPIMVAEISMGRNAQLNPYGAFRKIGNKNWGLVGLWGVLVGVMILSFYNVVAGWAFGYFLNISFGDLLTGGAADGYNTFFGIYIADFWDNLLFSLVFMLLTALIVAKGVQKGIERFTKILMPLLVLIIVGLIIYSLTLPGAWDGVRFYLQVDFGEINVPVVYEALAQAFFSLSLGMGALITYGSYFSKKENIVGSAALVTTADLGIAFLAGLMIFPLVFSQGLEPAAGPGLVFVALPGVFESMGPELGKFIGGGFFLLLCFAALTSTISLLEVPTAYVTDQFKTRRKPTVFLLALLIFAIGLFSMLSQGAVGWLTNFIYYDGQWQSFLTFIEDIFSNIGLPLGGFLIAVFVAYKWKMRNMTLEIEQGHPTIRGSWEEKFISIMLSFISPLFLGLILLITVMDKFFGLDIFNLLY